MIIYQVLNDLTARNEQIWLNLSAFERTKEDSKAYEASDVTQLQEDINNAISMSDGWHDSMKARLQAIVVRYRYLMDEFKLDRPVSDYLPFPKMYIDKP